MVHFAVGWHPGDPSSNYPIQAAGPRPDRCSSAEMLLLLGLGLGLTASAVLNDASVLPQLIGAALAYTPAVWLVVGLARSTPSLLRAPSVFGEAAWFVDVEDQWDQQDD